MMKLIDLLCDYHHERIRLPLMQRDYCWAHDRVQKLLDSLLKGWPIGCFYVWRSNRRQDEKGAPRRGRFGAGEFRYLLDGQQRLVSLQRAIVDGDAAEAGRAFYDLDKEVFRVIRHNKRGNRIRWTEKPSCIPLSRLISLNGDNGSVRQILDSLQSHYKKKDLDRYDVTLRKLQQLLQCDVEYRELQSDDVDVAVDVFRRLNSGRPLKKVDQVAADLAGGGNPKVLENIRKLISDRRIQPYGWGTDFFTRALVTFNRDDATLFKQGSRGSPEFKGPKGAEKSWEQVERSVLLLVKVLKEQIGWANRRWLPSANMLIPVMYALRTSQRTLKSNDIDAIRTFLCVVAIRGIAQGSVESTINEYIKPFKGGGRPDLWRLFNAIPKHHLYPLKPADVQKSWQRNSALMKVFLAYLVDNGAKSWPDHEPICSVIRRDPAELDVHHIFPQQLRIDEPRAWRRRDLDTMANYAIIGDGNSELRDEHPARVLEKMSEQNREDAELQCIPPSFEPLLRNEKFEVFCDERSKLIARVLNQFLHLM